jgi:two-component system response regulator YesN
MLKLMIVDDELLMRIGLKSMMEWERYGFQIVGEASNGREALELALAVMPDLIISDIKMPVMDGLAMIRELSPRLPRCQFVIFSNFDDFHLVKEALRLGASDYLIKSEIRHEMLAEVLNRIRQKLENDGRIPQALFALPDYTQSLTYLKENLFKETISGLASKEKFEALREQLYIRLQPEPFVVIKMMIDRFDQVKKKYVEKDEKLLRFSIVNIVEEITLPKRDKEVVVESSSEYLLFLNVQHEESEQARAQLLKLCQRLLRTVNDFMNLSISLGISSMVQGYSYIRLAYNEADIAVRRRFYEGAGSIIFFEDLSREPARDGRQMPLTRVHAEQFQHVMDSGNRAGLTAFLSTVRQVLHKARSDEETVRQTYLYLLEIANATFYVGSLAHGSPSIPPYEAILHAETWENMENVLAEHVLACMEAEQDDAYRSYTDMAIELINRYYAEDISLQSVASQINVNASYLSRIFKQETGENFTAYLTRIRIEKAKHYLASGRLRVSEVAHKVGYHNYTYFSKIFKKVVGMSPEDYRAKVCSTTTP